MTLAINIGTNNYNRGNCLLRDQKLKNDNHVSRIRKAISVLGLNLEEAEKFISRIDCVSRKDSKVKKIINKKYINALMHDFAIGDVENAREFVEKLRSNNSYSEVQKILSSRNILKSIEKGFGKCLTEGNFEVANKMLDLITQELPLRRQVINNVLSSRAVVSGIKNSLKSLYASGDLDTASILCNFIKDKLSHKFLKILGSRIVIEGLVEGLSFALSNNKYSVAFRIIGELIANNIGEKVANLFSNGKVYSSMIKSLRENFKNGDIDNIKSLITYMEKNNLKDTLKNFLKNENVISGIKEYFNAPHSDEEIKIFKGFLDSLNDKGLQY